MSKYHDDSEPYEVYASDILPSSHHSSHNSTVDENNSNINNQVKDIVKEMSQILDSRNTILSNNPHQQSNLTQSFAVTATTLATDYEDSLVDIPEHFIK